MGSLEGGYKMFELNRLFYLLCCVLNLYTYVERGGTCVSWW